MKITESVNYIRQQQPGQFRKPEEGMGPFAHVNNQKLNNIEERKEYSIYVSSEKIAASEKTMDSSVPKLFDFDAGMQFTLEKLSRDEADRNLYQKYDKDGNTEVAGKQEWIIDQWA